MSKGLLAAALCLGTLAASVPAAAQVRRNGDEYGGKDHQPTEAEVRGRERRDGIAPSAPQVDADRRAVDQLDRQLLHEEKVDPPTAPLPR